VETTDIENSRQPPAMKYGNRATTSILQGREPVYATGMINARMSNDHVKNYNDNLLDIGDPYTNLICSLGFAPPLHAPSGTATPPKNYDIKRPPSSTAGTAQHPLLIRLQINTYIEAVQLYIKLREFINGHNLHTWRPPCQEHLPSTTGSDFVARTRRLEKGVLVDLHQLAQWSTSPLTRALIGAPS